MLLLSVLALSVSLVCIGADQSLQADASASAGVPSPSYGPPAPAAPPQLAYAAPAEVAALADGGNYVQYPSSYGYSEPGFSVQTGYEGYLVPWTPQEHAAGPLGSLGLLKSLLPFSKFGLKFFPKFGVFGLGFLFLLLVGGALTTAVCAFTPICTISFLGLGLTRSTMRSYLTPDRLTQTTAFVLDAIDKYKDFSKKVSAKEARSKKDRRRR